MQSLEEFKWDLCILFKKPKGYFKHSIEKRSLAN